MTTLSEIENLEFRCIDLLTKAMPAASRRKLSAALDSLRATKRKMLAANPSVLRKLHTGPAPKDKPNALHPDATLGSAVEPKVFRAPAELCGMTIHTVAGMIAVPNHGVVETHPDHAELHQELRGRGFRELHGVDRCGKSAVGDPVRMFRPDALRVIGSDDGFLAALYRRADVVPGEQRTEHCDGPGPAPQYCATAADFRRQYFGNKSWL